MIGKSEIDEFLEESKKYWPDSVREIVNTKLKPKIDEMNRDEIKSRFDDLIIELEEKAYQRYLTSQKNCVRKFFKKFFSEKIKKNNLHTPHEIIDLFCDYHEALDRYFLSLSQSRRVRAGSTFEIIHNMLFRSLGYPFDEKKIVNGTPDFILPSHEHFKINPRDCIVFTVKRTLRERWRQVPTEGTSGLGFFLGTIDRDISERRINEAHSNRINFVIPKKIIEETEKFIGKPNILTFKKFFKDHVDPAVERWKRNSVI